MNNILDYQGLLTTELITSIQIHLYQGPQMTFPNTVLQSASKLLAPNLAPTFILHAQPQNALSPLPHSLLNQTHLNSKSDTYKLLLTLLAQPAPRPDRDEQANPLANNTIQIAMTAVLSQCEEISEVATVLNEDDLNPYWLLLNPILKLRQKIALEKEKKRILSASQFFKNGAELNEQHVLYRFILLQNYVRDLLKEHLPPTALKFIKLCLIALIKHLKANCPKLHDIALQQRLLAEANRTSLLTYIQINQFQKQAIDNRVRANGAYGHFALPRDPPKPKQPEQYATLRQKFTQSLIKPVSATLCLLILRAILST